MVVLFLGTDYPSNKYEGNDSGGQEDEKEEEGNICEANAESCGGEGEVFRLS